MMQKITPGELSVGTDLIEVKRFENFDFESRLAANLFTKNELEDCKKKHNIAASLAGRFAAKEAIKKCLEENIPYNHIEIVTTATGKPIAQLAKKQLQEKYRLEISFTHTKTFAQAICIALINKNEK